MVLAAGFCTDTCFPAASAARTWSWWRWVGVRISMASSDGSSSIWSRSAKKVAPQSAAACRPITSSVSHTAATSHRGSSRYPLTFMAAMLPAPSTPNRTFSTHPPLSARPRRREGERSWVSGGGRRPWPTYWADGNRPARPCLGRLRHHGPRVRTVRVVEPRAHGLGGTRAVRTHRCHSGLGGGLPRRIWTPRRRPPTSRWAKTNGRAPSGHPSGSPNGWLCSRRRWPTDRWPPSSGSGCRAWPPARSPRRPTASSAPPMDCERSAWSTRRRAVWRWPLGWRTGPVGIRSSRDPRS